MPHSLTLKRVIFPEDVISIKSTMRDHTMSMPAPENTVAFGIPNACTDCQLDKKATWAVDVLGDWWPGGRRMKMVARAEAFTAARAGRPDAVDRLIAIAADDRQGPLIQANAVGYLYMPGPRPKAALIAALTSDHPAIRTAAASSLGRIAMPDRSARIALLAALDDNRRAVRLAALGSLVHLGAGPFGSEDDQRFRRVSAEYVAAARLRPDDADIQTDAGFVQFLNGELEPASESLETALTLEPGRTRPIFLLALVRLGQGRAADARALLKQVPPSDPNYGAARDKLKILGR